MYRWTKNDDFSISHSWFKLNKYKWSVENYIMRLYVFKTQELSFRYNLNASKNYKNNLFAVPRYCYTYRNIC